MIEVDLNSPRQECSPNNLVFSYILFIAIFRKVTENQFIIISKVIILRVTDIYWPIYIAIMTMNYEIL